MFLRILCGRQKQQQCLFLQVFRWTQREAQCFFCDRKSSDSRTNGCFYTEFRENILMCRGCLDLIKYMLKNQSQGWWAKVKRGYERNRADLQVFCTCRGVELRSWSQESALHWSTFHHKTEASKRFRWRSSTFGTFLVWHSSIHWWW